MPKHISNSVSVQVADEFRAAAYDVDKAIRHLMLVHQATLKRRAALHKASFRDLREARDLIDQVLADLGETWDAADVAMMSGTPVPAPQRARERTSFND